MGETFIIEVGRDTNLKFNVSFKGGVKMRERVVVKFEPDGVKIEGRKGETVLDLIHKTGLSIRSECGGRQVCGKCKVIVGTPESCSEITQAEMFHLTKEEISHGYRLACACKILNDTVIIIPEESRIGARSVLVEGVGKEVKLEPYVRKLLLFLDKPDLSDVRSDLQRIRDSLKETYNLDSAKFSFELLSRLPEVLRDSGWKVALTLWKDKIIDVEASDAIDEVYGVAVDIGTSKIIGYLTDLKSGKLLEVCFIENPQISYGEDVISRITYASENVENLRRLHKVLIEGINKVISRLCIKAKCRARNIYEVTVVGNTVMHHLFLSLSTKFLGLSPYVPVVSEPINVEARELSLKVNPSANVHVLPVIAGFVGADAVADIIATGIHKSDELSMVVDIGTNTEVILGNKESIMASSCASGPAFEGAHIKCGMKAVTGAIERLTIDPKTLEVTYKTIGGSPPVGLCGSAVIDCIAELFKAGIIDRGGRMMDQDMHGKIRIVDSDREFVLVRKGEDGAKRDIVITQRDVREIQLAKSAIYTGCYILMKRMKVRPEDVEKCYVAGAFGNYLNLTNAKLIGMLPDLSPDKIEFVGNAAGAGARMALVSKSVREEAAEVARKVEYVELALDPDFQLEFASAMYLPHRDVNRFPSLKDLV